MRCGLRGALSVLIGSSFIGSSGLANAQDQAAPESSPRSDEEQVRNAIKSSKLADLTIEQLMSVKVKVTSASKKAENLADAPAAIFVMTSEDIRRGGFASLPEALRMVPGLYVAKVNSHWWTISARGFNDYLNNKMLVLIDGRSVYTPQFGGVFWELQDMPLDDIDRIEVIRGPGGTLWGANAVNGVINIVTKRSQDTQGFSLKTSAGNEEGYSASVRYGDRIGEDLTYRIFGKTGYTEPGVGPSGQNAYDAWNLSQGGIRVDSRLSSSDTLSFESGMYEGRLQSDLPLFTGPGASQSLVPSSYLVRGGHVLSRWDHRFSETSTGSLLGYCDWTDRVDVVDEIRNTCHMEVQHGFQIGTRHSLTWGLDADTTDGRVYESFTVHGIPAEQRTTTAGLFAQSDFDILPDRLRLSAGSKFEYNSYTGFEIQPQIRAVWTPSHSHSIWSAVSRAVRTPGQAYESEEFKFAGLPGAIPTYLAALGNPGLQAETLRAYELGYRFNPAPIFSLDAALFYNHYDNLINLNLVNPLGVAGPPQIYTNPLYAVIAVPWQNLGSGQTHGLEVYAKLQPVSRWMLAGGVTELRGNSVNFNDSLNLPVANSTRHQFNLQSRLNVTSKIEFDASLYHYNGVAGYAFSGLEFQDVPTHNRVDAEISFHAPSGLILSLWGRDLGSGPHWENRPPLFTTGGSQTRGQVIALELMWQPNPEARRKPRQ
ncbi:MAG TPA: TonB-dependent receptor [Bryobacteraceae bacterium]|nr:TonB-dependent receptor [Bryobacteraceae bacterium]